MLKNTEDLRNKMIQLYADVEAGKITNGQARTRVLVAKTIVDTLKVEITAAALGKTVDSMALNAADRRKALRVA